MTDQPISESLDCSPSHSGLTAADADKNHVESSPSGDSGLFEVRGSGTRPFGAELEPAMRRSCRERLSAITWFRTDWQRGGAATGNARYTDDDGCEQPVVVKLPVTPRERLWLERMQASPDVTPRLYAHGESLNGYDIAWVVMQRMPHGPLGSAWGGHAFDLAIEAAVRFHAAASRFPLVRDTYKKDWNKILDMAREKVRRHGVAEGQRWNKALKKAQHKLPQWLAIWNDRPIDQWLHGDLHLGNAMTASPPPDGPAVLLDLAEVHAGNWVEDAVYFEHLYWSRRELLEGRKICKAMAHERRKRGLPVADHWARLADVRRALLAMSTPAMLTTEGDPHHVHAALEVLERQVG